ncbi:MAG: alpha/beta hydrolase [Lachnospiraceae bacterium]
MEHKEISIRGLLVREVITHFSKEHLYSGKLNKAQPERPEYEPRWVAPTGFTMTRIAQPEFTMELLEYEKGNQELVILQLHGGGYIGEMRNIYRNFAVIYSEAADHCSVLTTDYRTAPEHPYPAAFEDAVNSYHWLLRNGYCGSQIVLAGDSAGGGLVLALAQYLRDQDIEMPKGIIAMSPWTDQTASGESYDTNYEKDPLFGYSRESLIYNHEYAGDHDLKDPYISPLFGDFTGLPPILFQVGSVEMLLSDSADAAKKAKRQGVKVKLSIYEGMYHVFQMALKLMPESKRAWEEVNQFLNVIRFGKELENSSIIQHK